MNKKPVKYSGFVFGEGRRDKKFLMALISSEKFQHHTKLWSFNYGNASGSSAQSILDACYRETRGIDYDLILCFIDLDDLKHKYPRDWARKKQEIENKYKEIMVIWQLDNAEQEYLRVLGTVSGGKTRINSDAIRNIERFINSDYWKRIKKVIKDREKELLLKDKKVRRTQILC